MRLCTALILTALAITALLPAVALAEDRERIFLVFGGEDAESLETAAMKFQGPVLGAERFEFAGTQEMEQIYASCTEEIGVDAATRRDCQLRAANRIMVTQVLELSAVQIDDAHYDIVLEVWSPESNGLLFGDTIEVEATSTNRAARTSFPLLAERYLCWRGVEHACPRLAPVETATAKPTAPPTTQANVRANEDSDRRSDEPVDSREAKSRSRDYFALGTEAYTSGDYSLALRHFTAARSELSDPEARAALSFNVAQCKWQLGDCSGALDAFRTAAQDGNEHIAASAQKLVEALSTSCD